MRCVLTIICMQLCQCLTDTKTVTACANCTNSLYISISVAFRSFWLLYKSCSIKMKTAELKFQRCVDLSSWLSVIGYEG